MIIIRLSLVGATTYLHLSCDPTAIGGTPGGQTHVLVSQETSVDPALAVQQIADFVKEMLHYANDYAGDLHDHLSGDCRIAHTKRFGSPTNR